MRKTTRGIIIPPESRSGVKRLTQEQKGHLLDAIYSYNIDGEIINMDMSVGIVFDMMKDFFDIQIQLYEEKSNKNKENIKKRWEKEKIQNDTTVYDRIPTNTNHTNKDNIRKEKQNKEKIKETDTTIVVGEQALVVEPFGNKDINDLLEIIKGQVEFLGLIYKKGRYERERAKNILTGKEFGEICEKANISRVEFCKSIIYMSSLLNFWNGKINNAETLYKHYAQVYNEAVNIKTKKQTESALDITL